MTIGLPKEIKEQENRVALTPQNVRQLVLLGAQVYVQKGAGVLSGFNDQDYIDVGAVLTDDIAKVWSQDLIIKVKEPLESEYQYFYPQQIIFTFLHLAANLKLTQTLLKNKVTAIAYETIAINHQLPILKPMSEIAGKRSILWGANLLEKQASSIGQGKLITSIAGVPKTNVVIIGGGIAGLNAALVALGLQAKVTIIEIDEQRIRDLDSLLNYQVEVLKSNLENIENALKDADLVVSTILIPGQKAPCLITEKMIKSMKPNSIVIDIAIDQGGSVQTIEKPTTHQNPYFIKHDVIHSAIANIPGIVPYTSTLGLTNASFDYVKEIVVQGLDSAFWYKNLFSGLNCYDGHIVHQGLAQSLNLEYRSLASFNLSKKIN